MTRAVTGIPASISATEFEENNTDVHEKSKGVIARDGIDQRPVFSLSPECATPLI